MTSFVLTANVRSLKPVAGEPTVALRKTSWDDHGYRAAFDVYVSENGQPFVEAGQWKIIRVRKGKASDNLQTTELPRTFDRLPHDYISLAQDVEHYRALAHLKAPTAIALLKGLNDVVFTQPEANLKKYEGFQRSLLRFSSAQDAYLRGRAILAGLGLVADGPSTEEFPQRIAFAFECQLPGFAAPHSVELNFSGEKSSLDLRRVCALVGRNGAGKTRVLGALARSLSGLEDEGTKVDPPPAFSRVIAVSYSAWDNFVRPKGEGNKIPYVYCGLCSPDGESGDATVRLDVEGAREIAAHDLEHILADENLSEQWRSALQSCGFDRVGSPLSLALGGTDFLAALEKASAGEQMVAVVVTRLVRQLRPGALVLFDEPELHLHPSLLSSLLRALQDLLAARNAFAIIATHSPIPLQELPAACIRVLELVDASPTTRRLDDQSFGASLGEIVGLAFGSRPDERNFATQVRAFIASGKTPAEILAALGGEPSLAVDLLLRALETE